MALRNIQIFSIVTAGQTDQQNSQPIPQGLIWVLGKMQFTDINMGDNKSTVYLLEFGSGSNFQIIEAVAITGDTKEIQINEELQGDGVKFLRLTRINNSASNKRCPVKITIYDKQ